MTEENQKTQVKKLKTFFYNAQEICFERSKTISEAFLKKVTEPITSIQKLKQLVHFSFPIMSKLTKNKMGNLTKKLKLSLTLDNLPNNTKASPEKMNSQLQKESGQIEEKNSSKVDQHKRCATPQSRIENNCNSSLAISQLEDQLIDRNAASFANMTLELSMNTNVLQQMAQPSKETNQSNRELNFDAISNPILEKTESQDGIIEQEQIKYDQNENFEGQDSQNKWKQVKNKAKAYNDVTETYRKKNQFFRFFQEAPNKIALKTQLTQKRLEGKLLNKPQVSENQNLNSQFVELQLTEIKKIENEQQLDEQKENRHEESIQQDDNKNFQQQEKEPESQADQSNYNSNDVQNIKQNSIDIQNKPKKHQESIVKFISHSGALMKKKTMDMFQQIENKIKLPEVQQSQVKKQQQTDVEHIKNDSNQLNQNVQIEKNNNNQVQEENQYQNQISDQDEYEYQVDPYLEEELKISKKHSNTIDKHNEFNYQDENSNQINDSQVNSGGELYSNDKLPQEITHIEKKSFHQDSFDASQMFDIMQQKSQDNQSQNQKSKITIQDNQSNQLTSKLFKQDELRQQYEEINFEIQQLQLINLIIFIHLEKQQLLPKKNILIKSTFKPNYKKLAEISDDNEALYKAKDLVRKMNQNRKDKDERNKKQHDKIEEYFHNLQYLKESQEEMKNRYEFQRKQQIQNRIEDYQKKQKEFAQLQKISHNFVQRLINVGPQQGQLAKEFEDNVISIKGGYRKVKLKNLGIELPRINESNNNAMFRRYMNEEQVKSKQDEMIKKYEASRQALFKSTD